MGGLTPFGVRFLMAVTTVLGGWEGGWDDELAGVGGCERGEKRLVGAEAVVIVLCYGLRVDMALRRGGRVELGTGVAGAQSHDAAAGLPPAGTDDRCECSCGGNLKTMAVVDSSEVRVGVGYPSKVATTVDKRLDTPSFAQSAKDGRIPFTFWRFAFAFDESDDLV